MRHTCNCGVLVEEKGWHGLSCAKSAGRFSRHHALNEVVRRALVSAGVPSVLEPLGLLREDNKRPDGATLIPWRFGRSLVWDVTCVDTLAPSNLSLATREGASVATRAEERKRTKYATIAATHIFQPVGFETLGSFGPAAFSFVKEIGARLRERTDEPMAGAYLMQRISVEIQRGNAIAILGTIPPSRALEDMVAYV